MEFSRSNKRIVVNRRKYALDIVFDLGLGNAKPAWTPLEANLKLTMVGYDKLVANTNDPVLEDKAPY